MADDDLTVEIARTGDPEAENAIAEIVMTHLGFVPLTVRYGIAIDAVRWMQHRG